MNNELNESTEEKKEVTLAEVVDTVQDGIDSLQEDLSDKFKDIKEAVVVAKPSKDYFITKNRLWDKLLQKLAAQFISVKIWVLALITVLLSVGLITSIQFASILGIIMGLKGTFSVASVWKQDKSDIIDRV